MNDIRITAIEANRQAWNESAPHHRDSTYWTELCQAIRSEHFNCLDDTLIRELQRIGLAGKRAAQLGCNNGRECFALRSLGAASVTGLDQSEAFLEQAAELSRLSPHQVDFVRCDLNQVPVTLHGQFDLLLITIGVLNWMPDLAAFFDAVSPLLRSGGDLLIYETHPLLEMLEPESATPLLLSNSYFNSSPSIDYQAIVYEGAVPDSQHPSYWFQHSLGDIFTAMLGCQLQIRHFREYPHCNREELYELYAQQPVQLPMCYTLQAHKP